MATPGSSVRVLYVNHTGRISGGEMSLLGLIDALPPQIDAAVACPDGPLVDRLGERSIERHRIRGTDGSLRLHPTRTPLALLEMAQTAVQVRRAAAATEADLIHANSIRSGLIASGAGRPTVVHVRDCLPQGLASSLTLRAIGRADALIANSAHTRSTMGPVHAKARVVHNAVDLTRFERVTLSTTEARARLGIGPEGPVLAVIAQITPWKAQDDAIRVARALLANHPRLQLLLVGAPKFESASTRYDNRSYLESLERMVAEEGLTGSVRFLGDRDDVPEVLRAVDVLLVPSWEEPFGRTVIEGMASGLPVVATDVGGPREILGQHECGILLPPREPEMWADSIQKLLVDLPTRAAMAERGRDAARRRFGVERHVSEVRAVYEDVLATGARG